MVNFKSYPHDDDLYLFKKDLINKTNKAPLELLIKIAIKNGIGHKNLLIENNKELTINDERELIPAAITVFNDLP